MKRERHGFVTFWLILLIVSNTIYGGIYFFNIFTTGSTNYLFIGVLCIAAVAASVLLLCWKKIGFLIFIISQVTCVPLVISLGVNIVQSVIGLVSIFILWGVLQITKNGHSAWDYITNKNTGENTSQDKTNESEPDVKDVGGIKKKKEIIISIVTVIVAVSVLLLLNFVLSPVLDDISLSNVLKKDAETENNKCPYTVEDGIVVEKVSFVKKDKKIIYEFRLMNYDKSDFYDLEAFKTNITQSLIQGIEPSLKTDDAVGKIKNKNVVWEYVYFDNQYEELARVKILLNEPVTAIE